MQNEIEDRMIELEIKISHQEVLIEQLQEGLFEQQSLMAKLEKSLKNLTERLDVAGASEVGPANEKPPHY